MAIVTLVESRSFFSSKFLTEKNLSNRLRAVFDRLFALLSSSQPPETASGSSLVQCLGQICVNREFLVEYFQLTDAERSEQFDQTYLLIDQIRKRLKTELHLAKQSLYQSAKDGPMYGSLSAINALLDIFKENQYQQNNEIELWRRLFTDLIDMSLEIASLTGPIVSSSSPEGMMPMELTEGLFVDIVSRVHRSRDSSSDK